MEKIWIAIEYFERMGISRDFSSDGICVQESFLMKDFLEEIILRLLVDL